MDSNTKQKIKIAFEKVKGAFEKVNLKETKDYYVTLGNINEVHLIKKDATKSVFLGKLFIDANSTVEEEARKIWKVTEDYFRGVVTNSTSTTTKEEVVTKPKTIRKRKPKVEEVPVVQTQFEDIDVSEDYAEEDNDYTWLDTIQ